MTWEVITGDCLAVMPTLDRGAIAAVITDPPYGCGKAEWDDSFPLEWYQAAREIAPFVTVITGSAGLADSIPLVGSDFVDVIAGWNTNGMTRGPLGFGNWLAAVVAGDKPKRPIGQNIIRFSVNGDKPDHPSPKPIEYMKALIERLTNPGDLIFDPFCGSGSTGVAAILTGRRFLGVEINPTYADIARARCARAAEQAQQLEMAI